MVTEARAAEAVGRPPPPASQDIALIELVDICRSFGGAGGTPATKVLRGVSMRIDAGEFVAIVGASGSGKSTLMNLLGCLDRPTSGQYRFAGQDIASFRVDELAWLRREAFGFVFQNYHLIRTLDALHNVEVPAVYAGMSRADRHSRAKELLTRLGLDGRIQHRPYQLSGGQQQRVSIARALMNGGRIILADEPTGALDTRSGAEVMALLRELADAGHTVILITHDRGVAEQARRVIEIRDGLIVSDNGEVQDKTEPPASTAFSASAASSSPSARADGAGWTLNAQNFATTMAQGLSRSASPWADMYEAVQAAWQVLFVNRFRTLLTLLGIIIGVASVIVMLAIGTGTQRTVMAKIASFGTNRMYVTPGGDTERGPGGTLSEADAALVAQVPNVDIAMPFFAGKTTVRAANVDVGTRLWAVTEEAPHVLNWNVSRGTFFTRQDVRTLATVAVLGKRISTKLFGPADPLGQYVLVNNVPFQVIGVLAEKGATSGQSNDDDVVLVPSSTGSRRVFGTANLSWISVLAHDLDKVDDTAADITRVLTEAHHVKDFQVYNQAASLKAQSEAQQTLTLTLGLIAAISLVVGGIGVMNIMLMTVRERTREIGIRTATGARQTDILRQFLTESVMVSTVGGVLGIFVGLAFGLALIFLGVDLVFSVRAMLAAFGCALATGLVFGYMPARQAARLDPIVALASD
ncbi:Macrolide export ATP-binding/permease protein MacB [Pandoraea horticolens]|uniref:Pyoverdine export ATP-binding/permease protein PvdT n=1 Tax=Pandoraea horticolens TaxID=2508298 RepID=A0A5E4WHW7_9BURK|nr:MacB family efflux pump subunit [Pandoraea horticolens]VVE23194.1 Macrolide export ATP-binding/permease protein MacB [Pandoraea horticolens]